VSTKLWGGRFRDPLHPDVLTFSSSLSQDQRLALADLRASQAHARSLVRAGVLTEAELAELERGLRKLSNEWIAGELKPNASAEDIHSEIERWLTEKVGATAGKLHTGRSRNDQVVTATRLYLRHEIDRLVIAIRTLQKTFVSLAESHTGTLLPGVTHLQHAQPVSLAHHLLAYFWMLERDVERLKETRARVNQLPLGAGALAGTPFNVDRMETAKELGFDGVCENSLDAVSDRDFVAEFLSTASLILVHLSRLSEEWVLWATPEYGFIELSDAVSTGSSLMPQKKNPDVAELIRGRVGRLQGAWIGMTTTLKGLPLSYQRDLQEDKVHLFAGLDCVQECVQACQHLIEGTKFLPEKMSRSLKTDFSNATDLADYLVKKGVPFRSAHEAVGKVVVACLEKGCALTDFPLADLQSIHPEFGGDVVDGLAPEAVVAARQERGGTSPEAVRLQIKLAKEKL